MQASKHYVSPFVFGPLLHGLLTRLCSFSLFSPLLLPLPRPSTKCPGGKGAGRLGLCDHPPDGRAKALRVCRGLGCPQGLLFHLSPPQAASRKGKRSFSGTPQYGSNKKKVRRESQEAIQMA